MSAKTSQSNTVKYRINFIFAALISYWDRVFRFMYLFRGSITFSQLQNLVLKLILRAIGSKIGNIDPKISLYQYFSYF